MVQKHRYGQSTVLICMECPRPTFAELMRCYTFKKVPMLATEGLDEIKKMEELQTEQKSLRAMIEELRGNQIDTNRTLKHGSSDKTALTWRVKARKSRWCRWRPTQRKA